MNHTHAPLATNGTPCAVALGSREYPTRTSGVYLGPSSDARFHWVQLPAEVGGQIVRVHEHQVSFPAPEAATVSFSTGNPNVFPKGRWTS